MEPMKMAPDKKRRRRRAFPIHAYIGANGGGKSLMAVHDSLPTLAAGRPIVSTVRILDPLTGEPHPLWVKLDDYRTLLEVEKCDAILDEVTGVASSRESAGMPAAVANLLVQLRRRDVALRWTAPNWKRADTIIREVSQGVTLCMGFAGQTIKADPTFHDGPHGAMLGPLLAPGATPTEMYTCRIEGPHEHQDDRQWSSKRLFYARTYDAAAFDEWTAYKKTKVRPSVRQLFWRPGSMASSAYDTFDAVSSLGAVTDAGLCMECDGHRPRKKCACDSAPQSGDRPARRHRVTGDRPVSSPPAEPQTGRSPGRRVFIPETDETPAVVLEHSGL